MGSLLAQSLKILKDAAVEQGKEYMGNTVELINDANTVRTDVMRVAKDSTGTLKNMVRSFNFRKIHDWYYQKENEYDDSGDDEYDPGFETGNEEEDTASTVLDRDAMKDITKRQSGIMVQLGARQAETTMASAAEIVSSINQRSSEILTSVNNINTTLLGISKKLDSFCNVYQAEKTEQSKLTLYDSQGRLSLNSIYNMAKNSSGGYVSDIMGYGSYASLLKQMSPAELLTGIYGMSNLGGKKLKVLGDNSIDDAMEKLNKTIGEFTQRGLEDLISTKAFKALFGDLKRGESSHNYKEDVVKGFNNKQATFDGYVRTTIIKTIPEYLRVIAKGVTGMNYNVGKNGELTQGTSTLDDEARKAWERDEKLNRDQYKQERWGDIAKSSFTGSGLSWSGRHKLFEERANKDLTRSEISMVTNTMTGIFAQLIYESNTNRLEPKMLLENSTMVETAITETANIMAASVNKTGVDWMITVRSIFMAIANGDEARNFCNGVNKVYQNQRERRTEFASSGSSFSSLAGKVNLSQVRAAAVKQNKDTIEVSDTLNKLDDAKEELRKFNKMSKPEQLRHGEEIRKLNEEIQKYERILREHGSGNTYNQTSYGNYLNIARNGCGPVALADMLNRSGMYDPKNGMKVEDFIKASSMMGHPLTPGSVNNMTLRTASKDNPITLLGSGPEFGTAYGNNHFVNVIGTDGSGNVYVMNPLDGKVHKRSINGVAGSSLVGLYGGGIGDKIRGKFDDFVSRTGEELYDSAKAEVSSFISDRFEGVSNRYNKYLEKSLKRAQDYSKRDDISQEDKFQMDLVMSMMETAAEDGDSGPDKQAIMMEISRIKNQKLKARLRTAVGGMIDRSAKKSEKGGLLSKIFSAGKGILKNFFAPLIAGITSALKAALGAAKKFMAPVIKYFKRQLEKNIGKITTGAKQVWQGTKELFKKKEKPEGESSEKRPSRLRNIFKRKNPTPTESDTMMDITEDPNARKASKEKKPSRLRNFFSRKNNDATPPTMDTITAPQVNPQPQPNTRTTTPLMPTINSQQTPPMMDSITVPNESNANPPTPPTPNGNNQPPVPNGNNQPPADGKNKKGSVFSRLGDKIGSKLGGKLGGITKILGGMGGILSGIAGILFNIFMGVQGFKALFTTVTSFVKGIAKSFNSFFKTLNKTIKPILKILTKSISEIVKSVTGIIAPVLQAIEPILTIIGEIASTVLKPLGPIMEFIGKVVGKIATFVLTPVQWIANGIKWIVTKFAKGLGVLLYPFDKKKRAQYYKDCGLTDTGEDKAEAEKKEKKKKTAEAKKEEFKSKSSEEKSEIAEKYAKRLHPVNKKKREEIYEKIMSGEISEDDAKKMLRRKLLATAAVIYTGGAGVAGYTLAHASKQVISKVKSGIHDKMTSGSKDEVANRLAKLMYPLNKTKREEIYDQIMSGKLSIEEAEKMLKRKSIDRAATVVSASYGGVFGILAKEGVSKTGQALIKYFKERDDKVDENNKEAQKQHEEERKEDQKLQLKLFKNGPLKMLSGITDLKDAIHFLKGVGTSIFGVGETAAGGIIGGLGRIITSIGELASLLPWVNEENKISLLGQTLLEKSDQMCSDGISQIKKGLRMMSNASTDFGDSNATTVMNISNSDVKSITNSASSDSGSETYSNGYQTIYSEGDIPYSNADVNVIGSGDAQSSYGNYLNMSRRGCGPVALADAYNRRTGSNISAAKLASKMTSHGAYDPSHGTSVGGYISASNALGMNTRIGGVTMNSLKKASPHNPITLVGSGVEFGTRNGNNHYLNAIGTDHYGGVYVSNPMTGRIQRRSANSVAGSSLMGIYGSGDIDSLASFSDETKEAMKNLMSLSGIFGKLFSTDSDSEVDDMVEEQKKEDRESKIANEARDNYSDEDYQNKVINAMDLYRADNPRIQDETVEAYEKRLSDKWSASSTIRNKYISMAVENNITDDLKTKYDSYIANSTDYYEPYVVYQKDAQGNVVHDESGNPIVTGGFKHLVEGADSEYVKAKKASLAVKKLGEALSAAVTANSGGGYTGAATGSAGGGGDTSGLIKSTALAFYSYKQNYPGGGYANCSIGSVTSPDGYVWKTFRPDCSGMLSAGMEHFGYTISGSSDGFRTYDFNENRSGRGLSIIKDKNGNDASGDWTLIDYSGSALQPGDMIFTAGHGSAYPVSHVGMFIGRDSSGNSRGLDGGGGEAINESAIAAGKILEGNTDPNEMRWTIQSSDSPEVILRYIGGGRSTATNENDIDSGIDSSPITLSSISSSVSTSRSGNVSGNTNTSVSTSINISGLDNLNSLFSSISSSSSSSSGSSSGSRSRSSSAKVSQGKIKLSKAMENASPQWKYYPERLTKARYWDAARQAGFTPAQTAMVAAIGIHENGAKKLTGEESLTRVVWDNIGKQYAFGLMNWIPDEKNSRSGANETKYGTTLAEQLKYIGQTYFSPTSTYDRAKNVNFNRYYGSSMKEALGYAPKLGQGDRWGPYADTDIAESMGHYVGNALVPYDFARTSGQARHMRTAVEAYNWMLDNGEADGYTGVSSIGSSGGSAVQVKAFDISALLGDYVNDLPDYYKNMLTTVQGHLDSTASAINAANAASSSYSLGDYDFDDTDQGEGEADDTDTRTWATTKEVKDLYNTMILKSYGSAAWSNSQLLSKGYGEVILYIDHSDGSKLSCKLQNNKTYSKVTTWGSWVFVYAGKRASDGRPYCGWGHSSDFTTTDKAINKKNDHTYEARTVNPANSLSDVLYNNWKSLSDNYTFYKPKSVKDATGATMDAKYTQHWFTAKGPYKGKYKTTEATYLTSGLGGMPKTIEKKVDAPYVTIGESYDKTIKNVNRDILVSSAQSKTLGELRKTSGACGDFDYDTTDSGFFIPGGIYGSGDEDSINSIPPLNNNILDTLTNYGYGNEGSYTVNNYTIQGGINNDTADLTRTELLNYLVGTEFTTRSPRTEKILNKILEKLDNINATKPTSTTTNTSNMYDDEIPDVIKSLVRS